MELEKAKTQVTQLETEKRMKELELKKVKKDLKEVMSSSRGNSSTTESSLTMLHSVAAMLGLWGMKSKGLPSHPVFQV